MDFRTVLLIVSDCPLDVCGSSPPSPPFPITLPMQLPVMLDTAFHSHIESKCAFYCCRAKWVVLNPNAAPPRYPTACPNILEIIQSEQYPHLGQLARASTSDLLHPQASELGLELVKLGKEVLLVSVKLSAINILPPLARHLDTHLDWSSKARIFEDDEDIVLGCQSCRLYTR